jgi:histidinol phosphatase-like enzyme (inositol monophosphatase family)
MTGDPLPPELLAFALRLADAARAAALPWFRAPELRSDNKAAHGFDPVTEADRAAERAMRALILEERPDDGVDGEEYGATPGRSGLIWRLDPVDGTRAFVAGLPSWTTLIGLTRGEEPLIGVIDQPWLDERYVGAPGAAWLDVRGRRQPLQVRDCAGLTAAILSTTDPFIFTASERGAFDHLRATARLTRYGLDAYAYARLAAGTIDLVVESGLKAHDVAALIPVIVGAGGLVANWRGEPPALGGQLVAAANRQVLDQALISLRRSAQ